MPIIRTFENHSLRLVACLFICSTLVVCKDDKNVSGQPASGNVNSGTGSRPIILGSSNEVQSILLEEIACEDHCARATTMCGAAAFNAGLLDMEAGIACFGLTLASGSESKSIPAPVFRNAAEFFITELKSPNELLLPYIEACGQAHEDSIRTGEPAIPCLVLAAIGEAESANDKATAQLLEPAAKALEMANRKMYELTGEQFKILWSKRSNSEQAMIYVRNIYSGAPAFLPGTSAHEVGMAVDLEDWVTAGPFMAMYGFTGGCAAGEDGPQHFEFMVEAAEAANRGCRFVPKSKIEPAAPVSSLTKE